MHLITSDLGSAVMLMELRTERQRAAQVELGQCAGAVFNNNVAQSAQLY